MPICRRLPKRILGLLGRAYRMFVFSLHSCLSLSAVKFFLQLISIALLRLIYFHNLFRGEYFPELIIIFLAHIQYLTALCKNALMLTNRQIVAYG